MFQFLADGAFQHAHVHHVFRFGNAGAFGKQAQPLGRVAAAAHTGDGGHARVVPAADVFFGNQLVELAFGRDGIQQFQARELVLMWARGVRRGNVVQHPVIQRAVGFKFERAQRVGDAFDGVGNAVGVVVHRVDAPFVAGVVVVGAANAVDDGVAHVYIARGHVNFQTQGFAAVWERAVAHFIKQIKVFFHAALAVGAVFARFGERAAVFAHLLGG